MRGPRPPRDGRNLEAIPPTVLDRTIIWNQRQLERVVVDYIEHYNSHRPHRSLDQRAPLGTEPPLADPSHLRVVKSTRCAGLIKEYQHAA